MWQKKVQGKLREKPHFYTALQNFATVFQLTATNSADLYMPYVCFSRPTSEEKEQVISHMGDGFTWKKEHNMNIKN